MKDKYDGVIKFETYTDRVNSWELPEENLIFATYGYPYFNRFYGKKGRDLSLRIYKRRLREVGKMYNCFSFVLGLWDEDKEEWLAIDGFNLTGEQIKEIFK